MEVENKNEILVMKTPQKEAPQKEDKDEDKDKIRVDLRAESKKISNKAKSTYDLVDDEIKIITLDNDLVVKLIANNKGVFVDFRKHYKGYPTKKGIRIIASKFNELANILQKDIKRIVPCK